MTLPAANAIIGKILGRLDQRYGVLFDHHREVMAYDYQANEFAERSRYSLAEINQISELTPVILKLIEECNDSYDRRYFAAHSAILLALIGDQQGVVKILATIEDPATKFNTALTCGEVFPPSYSAIFGHRHRFIYLRRAEGPF